LLNVKDIDFQLNLLQFLPYLT